MREAPPLPPWSADDVPALCIAGGRVIDPWRGVDAVGDVWVQAGRVVERLPAGMAWRTLDASGRLVLPGAIDMHTHIASRGVALARELDPALAPGPRETAWQYLRMGYTSLVDAAVPPEDVTFAHDRLDRMPHVDTGFLLELGSHDELIEALAHHGEAAAIEVIDRLIERTGAFGLKLVSLRHADGLDARVGGTSVTARQLIHFAAKAAAHLPAAHPLQLHVPELGGPDNIDNTIAALEALAGERGHLAHAQFYAYRQDASGAVCSAAPVLCDYLARHGQVTMDSGCIAFGPACMVTRDHLLASYLAKLLGGAMRQRDGWSVMPMRYAAAHPVNAVQWATGLELILRSVAEAGPGRMALSVDHPNGGSCTAMPGLLALLANRSAREAALGEVHAAARERTGLAAVSRELSERELVVLTRMAPARALGLTDRGHLGAGAVGDVVVTPRVWDEPGVVVKSGRVVVEDGRVAPGARDGVAGMRLGAG